MAAGSNRDEGNGSESATEETTNGHCLNCMHALASDDRFCPSCGQSTRDLRISIWALLRDLVDGIFSLDSKLVRSLVPLLLKPGALTRAFIDGKRARYLPPVRMYLFFSVLFFLSLSLSKPSFEGSVVKVSKNEGHLITLRDELEEMEAQGGQADREAILERIDEAIAKEEVEKGGDFDFNFGEQEETGDGFWEKLVQRHVVDKAERIEEMKAEDVLKALYPLMLSYISWSLFFLMPVFAFIMKILYIRRDPVYLDHLIFAFHYHSFTFLFLSLLEVWEHLMPIEVETPKAVLMLLVPSVYLYAAVRRVYRQGRIKTLVKLGLLSSAYFFALMTALSVAAIASFIMADF